jgi:hypothetical protein
MSRWIEAAWLVGLVSCAACVGRMQELGESTERGPRLLDGGPADPFDDASPADREPPVEAPPAEPPPPMDEPDAGPGSSGPAPIAWKAAVMAGDDSIDAFDNARETVHGMFLDDGVRAENAVQLSRRDGGRGGVRDMSVDGLLDAMLALDVGPGDGCVLFMTSHGSTSGFYIEGRGEMSPEELGSILDEACGDRPTVVLVSACYSGIFIEPMARPNRIILTAARPDRTSFGCSADETYTYWDTCLIESYPTATTWAELYDTVTACVVDRESGFFTPSEPQSSFGSEVRDLAIFDRE